MLIECIDHVPEHPSVIFLVGTGVRKETTYRGSFKIKNGDVADGFSLLSQRSDGLSGHPGGVMDARSYCSPRRGV